MPPMPNPARRHAPWACHVVCPHCQSLCKVDWFLAHSNPDGGYDLTCRHCNQEFNFTAWQYSAACPACGTEFVAKMNTTIGDNFDYQQKCQRCGGMMHFKRDGAPAHLSMQRPTILKFDASHARKLEKTGS